MQEPRPYTKDDYGTGELNMLSAEKETIIKAMTKTNGNIRDACLLLDISERTLHAKLPRHHIKREYFLKTTSRNYKSRN